MLKDPREAIHCFPKQSSWLTYIQIPKVPVENADVDDQGKSPEICTFYQAEIWNGRAIPSIHKGNYRQTKHLNEL